MRRGTHYQEGRGQQRGGMQDRNSLFQDMMYNELGTVDQGISNNQSPQMLNLSTSNRGTKSKVKSITIYPSFVKVKSKSIEQKHLNQSDHRHNHIHPLLPQPQRHVNQSDHNDHIPPLFPQPQIHLNQSDHRHDHIPPLFPQPLKSQRPRSNSKNPKPRNSVAPFPTKSKDSKEKFEVQSLIFNNSNQNVLSNMTIKKKANKIKGTRIRKYLKVRR